MHVSGGLWPNSAHRGNPDLTLSAGSNLGYDTSLRTPVARESCGCSGRRRSLFAAARRTDAACCAKTVNARGGRPICSRPGGYQSASRPRHGKQPRQPAAALREWPRGGRSLQQVGGRFRACGHLARPPGGGAPSAGRDLGPARPDRGTRIQMAQRLPCSAAMRPAASRDHTNDSWRIAGNIRAALIT